MSPRLSLDRMRHIGKKVSLIAFRQILRKIFPAAHNFSFILMTYLKKFIRIKSLNTKQCPAGLSSRIIPLLVFPLLRKMSPLLYSCFVAHTRCQLSSPFPQTLVGNSGDRGRIPSSIKKNAHFCHQKNPLTK